MKLSKRILAVMLACVMALCMLTACGGGGGGGTSGGSGTVVSGDLTESVNAALKSAGIDKTLTHDEALDEKAEKYASVYTGEKDTDYAAAGIDRSTESVTYLGTNDGSALSENMIVSLIVSDVQNYIKFDVDVTAYGYYRTATSIYLIYKRG